MRQWQKGPKTMRAKLRDSPNNGPNQVRSLEVCKPSRSKTKVLQCIRMCDAVIFTVGLERQWQMVKWLQVFQYASEDVRGNSDLVLEAVQQLGAEVLVYVSETLQGDPHFMMEVLRITPPPQYRLQSVCKECWPIKTRGQM
eukprot:102254-Amphidinium_carterae.2